MDQVDLEDEFDSWVKKLERTSTPQWVDPAHPSRWRDQASEAELNAMATRAQETGTERPEGGLLVLVAGTSPQPCLLSALWRRPDRVIVACSEDPMGQEYANLIEQELRRAEFDVLCRVQFPSTDPVATFECLRQRLEEHYACHPEDAGCTVLDITGGKKPMVAAAYFLAAWREIPAVYVDAAYDPRARMPRPCTAEPRMLGNPGLALGLFALREAEALWGVGAYRAADDLLGVAAQQLGAAQVAGARSLACAVMAWEDLHYDRAVDLAPGGVPEAVRHLGARWREIRSGAKLPGDWHRALRRDPWHMLLHAVDVVQWARRRLDREQRTLFLTLFSLGELVFGMVLAHAWDQKQLQANPSMTGGFDDAVWTHFRVEGNACKLLVNGSLKDKKKKTLWTVPPLAAAGPWTDQRWKNLRNVAAHGLAIVEREDVEAVSEAMKTLVREAAVRIRTAPGPDGQQVPLAETVAGWLEPASPWFAPPAWVDPTRRS